MWPWCEVRRRAFLLHRLPDTTGRCAYLTLQGQTCFYRPWAMNSSMKGGVTRACWELKLTHWFLQDTLLQMTAFKQKNNNNTGFKATNVVLLFSIYTHTCTRIHTRIHTHTHTHAHTHAHAHIHTRKHAHAHIFSFQFNYGLIFCNSVMLLLVVSLF